MRITEHLVELVDSELRMASRTFVRLTHSETGATVITRTDRAGRFTAEVDAGVHELAKSSANEPWKVINSRYGVP